ncbi:MAG: hypothetical protein SGCHY_002480 [Lobulomycetales sp.]
MFTPAPPAEAVPLAQGRTPTSAGSSQSTLDFEEPKDADGEPAELTSRPRTAVNIMKTIIGAGIFATPAALERAGFVFGLFMICGVGLFIYFTVMILVKASEKTRTRSLQSLVNVCFGSAGEIFLNLVLFVVAWSSMAAYTVIIGDVIPDILHHSVGGDAGRDSLSPAVNWLISRRAQVLFWSWLVLFPISLAKSLARLAKFSIVALVGIVFIIISVLVTAPSLSGTASAGSESISFVIVSGIPGAVSIISFAYICQHNILLNYASLRRPSVPRFESVVRMSMVITVILTIAIGMAYLTFREQSEPNILNSFPRDIGIITVCRLIFALDMFFTYPLELFIARDTIEQAFFRKFSESKTRHVVITFLLVASTVAVGLTTCELGMILELGGGIAGSFIAFVIPAAIWIKSHSISGEPLSRKSQIMYGMVIMFGILLMVTTISVQISESLDPARQRKDCEFQ